MILTVEVNGVEFTVDFDVDAGQEATFDQEGFSESMDFNSVHIGNIDIWECLNMETLDKIEKELWGKLIKDPY